VVELPEIEGFDRIEVSYFTGDALSLLRHRVLEGVLDRSHFVRAGGCADYSGLAFASSRASDRNGPVGFLGTASWPEDYGDPDIYRVWGDESETDRRINIVILPDGYTYAEKSVMEGDAGRMVDYFRSKTPFAEHDPFLNYILVYAYSAESGTDQCDCKIVKNTIFNTRFPDAGGPCGDMQNRCLFYGGGATCDNDTSTANIGLAELRAPAREITLIMVNTSRYGGCGGPRAVFAAGNSSGPDIAVHEFGHSLAGLADEYGGTNQCRRFNGYNVASDSVNGNWPEWIPYIGAPVEGANYYDRCTYRPISDCEMRSLNVPFCPVCDQRWALMIFDHWRINPTAPIETFNPPTPVAASINIPVDFSITTRLAQGANVTNDITWRLQGPGFPAPTTVAAGVQNFRRAFTAAGNYTLASEVVADTNFIKPQKNGPNVDVATWSVAVAGCDAAPVFLGFGKAEDIDPCALTGIRVSWSPAQFGPSGGAYKILRDGQMIAQGIAASPYVDLPGNTLEHQYAVAAVSADCSVETGNAVVIPAADKDGSGILAALGNSLRAAKAAGGITIRWTDEPGDWTYSVARSASRDFSLPRTDVGSAASGDPGVEDSQALSLPGLYTFRVAKLRCSVTGPW
jgi:hypothetical protein